MKIIVTFEEGALEIEVSLDIDKDEEYGQVTWDYSIDEWRVEGEKMEIAELPTALENTAVELAQDQYYEVGP